MEKKKDVKGLLVIILAIIVLLFSCFVVYDKLLKKETCDCPKTECKCKKCDNDKNKNDCIESDYDSEYDNNPTQLYGKYVNIKDKKSNIVFSLDGTWKLNRNVCHGYENISGTYSVDANRIILKGTNHDEEGILSIVSTTGEIILLLDEERFITGCSGSRYFLIQE